MEGNMEALLICCYFTPWLCFIFWLQRNENIDSINPLCPSHFILYPICLTILWFQNFSFIQVLICLQSPPEKNVFKYSSQSRYE
jgi:hypothetical protein